MGRQCKISVIIPVYNGEKYLAKCLDSVIPQIADNDELLIVNDGSTDNTKEICDKYKAKMPYNITVINKKNEGLVESRIRGAEFARGLYLVYIDSDDWIESDYLLVAKKIIDKYEIDILTMGCVIDEELSSKKEVSLHSEGLYSNTSNLIHNMIFDFYYGQRAISASIWGKAIRKELFLNITKDIDKSLTIGEDGAVIYPMIAMADTVYISHYCGYHYVQHSGSMLNKMDLNSMSQIARLEAYMIEKFETIGLCDVLIRNQVKQYCLGFIKRIFSNYFIEDYFSPKLNIGMNLDCYKRVVIYGAGKIGCEFVESMLRIGKKPYMWVDEKATGKKYGIVIDKPTEIMGKEIDLIVIAIENKEVADEVRETLFQYGFSEEDIKWQKNYYLYD